MKNLFELIYCKGCGMSVHSICYGIETPTETLEEKESKKFFQCDRCLKGAADPSLVKKFLI